MHISGFGPSVSRTLSSLTWKGLIEAKGPWAESFLRHEPLAMYIPCILNSYFSNGFVNIFFPFIRNHGYNPSVLMCIKKKAQNRLRDEFVSVQPKTLVIHCLSINSLSKICTWVFLLIILCSPTAQYNEDMPCLHRKISSNTLLRTFQGH